MLWKRTRKYVSSSLSLTTKYVLSIEHACPALNKHAVLLIPGVVFAHCSLNSTSRPLARVSESLYGSCACERACVGCASPGFIDTKPNRR